MSTWDREKFVDREKVLNEINDKINRLARGDPFAPHERVIHIVGPSGIGKSFLLEKCYEAFATDPKFVPILVKLENLGSRRDEFVGNFLTVVYEEFCRRRNIKIKKKDESLSKYSTELIREINKHKEDCIVVLFLDEMNIPRREELRGMEEHLLERLIEDNKRVVLITAGRSPAGLNHFSLRPNSVNTLLLSVFDEKTIGEQLEKLKPGSALVAGKVLELGGGVPGNNRKLAEFVVGDPPNIPNELQAVQSLLSDVKHEIEERFHLILEAICILSVFMPDDTISLLEDHPMLGDGWHERKIKQVFTDLNKVQFGPSELIRWDKEKKSWVMDERTRTLFEQELRMRDPELWRKLHCTAYRGFKKWGEELNSQLYRDKAMYHQLCLQSAGIDCNDLRNEG